MKARHSRPEGRRPRLAFREVSGHRREAQTVDRLRPFLAPGHPDGPVGSSRRDHTTSDGRLFSRFGVNGSAARGRAAEEDDGLS
jgi:hypothetical protein